MQITFNKFNPVYCKNSVNFSKNLQKNNSSNNCYEANLSKGKSSQDSKKQGQNQIYAYKDKFLSALYKAKRSLSLMQMGIKVSDIKKEIVGDRACFNAFVDFLNTNGEVKEALINRNYSVKNAQMDTLQFHEQPRFSLKLLGEEAERSLVILKHQKTPNGLEQLEKIEYDNGVITSWYKDGDSIFRTIMNKDDTYEQAEIILNPQTKEPEHIVVTKPSTVLKGMYDVTSYELKDFPEEYDVIEGIRKGLIPQGKIISKTRKKNDGTIEYTENFEHNGYKISRYWSEDAKKKTNYKFLITDDTDKKILDMELNWEQVEDGTVTTVNGEKFHAKFYDNRKIVEITKNGERLMYFNFDEISNHNEKLWESVKNMPATMLIALGAYIKSWTEVEPGEECIKRHSGILASSCNNFSTYHELGHCATEFFGKLDEDKELIQIYKEELEEFEKTHTTFGGKDYLQYLSETGGSRGINSGLDELIADAHAIFSQIGDRGLIIHNRIGLLVSNFPRTLSYIATKFNLNNVNSESMNAYIFNFYFNS